MSDRSQNAMDYPWEVHLHTTQEHAGHPLYSVTTSQTQSPYWLIAAPLTLETASHIAEMHNYWLEGSMPDEWYE